MMTDRFSTGAMRAFEMRPNAGWAKVESNIE
jgi:hypothetical protein